MWRLQVDQLIERMDLNQDGHIAWDEFSSALVDWKMVRTLTDIHRDIVQTPGQADFIKLGSVYEYTSLLGSGCLIPRAQDIFLSWDLYPVTA